MPETQGRAAMPWRNAAISAGPPIILAVFRKSQTKNDLTKMAFRPHTRLSYPRGIDGDA
jgi:hypothetical protein